MKTKQQILEEKIRKMVRKEMLKEEPSGFLRDSDLASAVNALMTKLEQLSGSDDSIALSEAVIDYLNKKYLRYKSAYQKYGK